MVLLKKFLSESLFRIIIQITEGSQILDLIDSSQNKSDEKAKQRKGGRGPENEGSVATVERMKERETAVGSRMARGCAPFLRYNGLQGQRLCNTVT